MKPYVIAVVVCHDANDFLATTLQATKAQSRPADLLLIVDSGGVPAEISGPTQDQQVIRVSAKSNLKSSIEAALATVPASTDQNNRWLWLLHDDSAPNRDTLAKLLEAVELSPSVAVAGPKQVAWNNQKIITQQGLTLTPMGDLFSLVHGQLDQGQHDHTDDVMAVGTAGALINLAVYEKVGGLDKKAPPFAADIDFSIRVRLAGHRVAVVPAAKVAHAGLSLAGKRPRRWLGTSPKAAQRRAAIHLRLAYAPLAVALAFWLVLPLIGVGRAVWRIASKRPDRIWAEISAALWGFFTLPARLSSRATIAKSAKTGAGGKLAALKPLRASWQQVSSNRRSQFEQDQSQATIEAFERGEFDQVEQASTKGFIASGGFWVMLALTALSFSFWPSNIAVTGGGVLPLSASWFEVFSRAGASFQPIGLGYFAPSDPFVWVLTLLGSLTFWAPSLSIALLLLLAKALAFAGAWRAVALFTQSSLVRTLAALSFALWPSLINANTDGALPALVSQLALPWLVLAVARAAGLGNRSLTKTANQTWVWVGLAGLLLAIIGASTPSLLPILLLALSFVIIIRIRRLGYLIWIPLPIAALSAPTSVFYLGASGYLGITAPLAQLADPGLSQATQKLATWQLLLGGESFGVSLPVVGQISLWLTIPVLGLALLALITKKFAVATTIWIFALLALASAYLMQSLRFPALGNGSTSGAAQADWVSGSTSAHLGLVGLCVAMLAAVALDQVSAKVARIWLAGVLVAFGLLPTAALAAALPSQFEYSDGRVVPSIVAAEAALGSQLKLLSISPKQNPDNSMQLQAELISGDGVHLEDVSVSYRFALANLQNPNNNSDELALAKAVRFAETKQLVADLASANGSDLNAALAKTGVGYVLVPNGPTGLVNELALALDSVKELESIGSTDFGQLWRVLEPNRELLESDQNESSLWSITKVVQLSILLSFILLAIPSGVNRRAGKDSSIFVEAGEDN